MDLRVGLCATCQHVRRLESGRGSVFYLCEAARNDPRRAKYPRLPVLDCHAHVRAGERRASDARE